ncbi:V-type proton ATPase subunit a3 [Dorcoceras hygrometricum]|uniref:V-type proton ATPase subunit a3 n=1 Tax=Dorcoceras hygrometricum TaxID=472368 RepID=A0A2Z7B5Z1_9LAMI|nr:V-type proton ATPase subunit a3 [Dorcoceras hygrometricum]
MPNPRCKTSSHPYLKSLCNNYYKQGLSNADPPPAKPTQATAQGPKHRKATTGSYELNQLYPTSSNSTESSKQRKTWSEHLPQQARTEPDAYANRLHKGDVFAHLTSFKQTSENNIQPKSLSKRSPTLPLLLQSELSTIGNRRR